MGRISAGAGTRAAGRHALRSPVAAAMLAAGAIAGFLVWRNPNIGRDGLHYLFAVHNLLDGRGYTYAGEPELLLPPGYGLASYLFYLFVRDVEYSGMLTSALAYVLLLPAAARAAGALFGAGSALPAALFVAACPALVRASYVTLSEPLYCLFLVLAAGTFASLLREAPAPGRGARLGAWLGIAYLVRPEAILIAALAIGWMFLAAIRSARGRDPALAGGWGAGRFRALGGAAAALGIFAVLALPYLGFLHRHLGFWTVSGKLSPNLYLGEAVEEGPERATLLGYEHPEYFEAGHRIDVAEYLRERGALFALRVRRNAGALLREIAGASLHALWALAAGGVVAGAALARRRGRGAGSSGAWPAGERPAPGGRAAAALAIFLSPLPALLLFFVAERLTLPHAILLMLFLSWGVARLLEGVGRRLGEPARRRVRLAMAAAALLSLGGALPGGGSRASLIEVLRSSHAHAGLRAAGLWLGAHPNPCGARPLLAVSKGDVALFYAAGKKEPAAPWIGIPPGRSLPEIARAMEAGEAGCLLLEDHYSRWRPEVRPLWDDPALAASLGIEAVRIDPSGRFQIYALASGAAQGARSVNSEVREERWPLRRSATSTLKR